MTLEQEQEERDQLYALHVDYADTVTLMRRTRTCDKDMTDCPCVECIVLRRWIKFRDRLWNAYSRLAQNPGDSPSQQVVEAAIPLSEKERGAAA